MTSGWVLAANLRNARLSPYIYIYILYYIYILLYIYTLHILLHTVYCIILHMCIFVYVIHILIHLLTHRLFTYTTSYLSCVYIREREERSNGLWHPLGAPKCAGDLEVFRDMERNNREQPVRDVRHCQSEWPKRSQKIGLRLTRILCSPCVKYPQLLKVWDSVKAEDFQGLGCWWKIDISHVDAATSPRFQGFENAHVGSFRTMSR